MRNASYSRLYFFFTGIENGLDTWQTRARVQTHYISYGGKIPKREVLTYHTLRMHRLGMIRVCGRWFYGLWCEEFRD